MTPDRLAAIRERLAKATPGPWHQGGASGSSPKGHRHLVIAEAHDEDGDPYIVAQCEGWMLGENADLIAHAPEDLAFLLVDAALASSATCDRCGKEAVYFRARLCPPCSDEIAASAPSGREARLEEALTEATRLLTEWREWWVNETLRKTWKEDADRRANATSAVLCQCRDALAALRPTTKET